MGTHPTLNIFAAGGDTSGKDQSTEDESGRVLDQLRERALALRAEVDSILADIDRRRKQQVQKPIVETVESIERAIKEFQAKVHPDGNTYTEVISRPLVSNRHIGFGPTTREIDDFIQTEVLRAGRPRPQDGCGVVLENASRFQREDRPTDR